MSLNLSITGYWPRKPIIQLLKLRLTLYSYHFVLVQTCRALLGCSFTLLPLKTYHVLTVFVHCWISSLTFLLWVLSSALRSTYQLIRKDRILLEFFQTCVGKWWVMWGDEAIRRESSRMLSLADVKALQEIAELANPCTRGADFASGLAAWDCSGLWTRSRCWDGLWKASPIPVHCGLIGAGTCEEAHSCCLELTGQRRLGWEQRWRQIGDCQKAEAAHERDFVLKVSLAGMVIDDFCTFLTKTIGLEHKVVMRYVKKRHIWFWIWVAFDKKRVRLFPKA